MGAGTLGVLNLLRRSLSIPLTREDGQLSRSSYPCKVFLCVRPFSLNLGFGNLNLSTVGQR